MGLPAARETDEQQCVLLSPKPHLEGTITKGFPMVTIEGLPAARFLDSVICSGDPGVNYVAGGAATVLVGRVPAARVSDQTFHGGFITGGAGTVFIGGPRIESWTIAGVRDILCSKDPGLVKELQKIGKPIMVMGVGAGYTKCYWNGQQWVKEFVLVDGFNNPEEVQIVRHQSNENAVNTLFHENYHASHPHDYSALNEYETEVATEQWAIDHGLPEGRRGFRMKDKDGRWVVNKQKVREFVEDAHGSLDPPVPSPDNAAPPQPDKVVEHNVVDNRAVVERSDKSRYNREPRLGDAYMVENSTVTPDLQEIDTAWLTCP